MRVLAVDPGERHIGLAVSDATGTVARPLATLRHQARAVDAERIAAAAAEQGAELILIGYALDAEGRPGPQARHAEKLAAAVGDHTALPVRLYDESYSTQAAGEAMRAAGRRRRARQENAHAVAAAVILQSYLDGNPREAPPG